MPIGVLTVTILKAESVYDSDVFGKSDPYVIVSIGSLEENTNTNEKNQQGEEEQEQEQEQEQQFSTFVASVDQNGTALWDERLTFMIEKSQDLNKIKFEIFDKDRFGSDDHIFTTSINLSLEGYILEQEKLNIYKLVNDNGTLHVVVHYTPMTIMEKIYEKLNTYGEKIKDKLISQIVTFVQSQFLLMNSSKSEEIDIK